MSWTHVDGNRLSELRTKIGRGVALTADEDLELEDLKRRSQVKLDTTFEAVLMNFGDALDHLKGGIKLTRAGWNGPGQYVYLVPAGSIGDQWYLPFMSICTVQGEHVPWLASQTDLLAEDWMVVQ